MPDNWPCGSQMTTKMKAKKKKKKEKQFEVTISSLPFVNFCLNYVQRVSYGFQSECVIMVTSSSGFVI